MDHTMAPAEDSLVTNASWALPWAVWKAPAVVGKSVEVVLPST